MVERVKRRRGYTRISSKHQVDALRDEWDRTKPPADLDALEALDAHEE